MNEIEGIVRSIEGSFAFFFRISHADLLLQQIFTAIPEGQILFIPWDAHCLKMWSIVGRKITVHSPLTTTGVHIHKNGGGVSNLMYWRICRNL